MQADGEPHTSEHHMEWERPGSALPPPGDAVMGQDLLWHQLKARFEWYDSAATRTRRAHLILKTATLVVAATVPVLAATGAPGPATASLGAAVVVSEGLQQLFQFQSRWISYRTTAETLRDHGLLWAASVDPYDNPATRRERLASLIRNTATQDLANWADGARSDTKSTASASP